MITFGAVYLFKYKLLQEPILSSQLHLLTCSAIQVNCDSIELACGHRKTLVKVKHAPAIGGVLAQIVAQCTFKVPNLQLPTFSAGPGVTLERVKLTARPANALQNRAIFLSHFYDISGVTLDAVAYFDKYDQSPKSTVSIAPGFHAGPFVPAIAHAIGWETAATIVLLDRWGTTVYDQFIENLLIHAQTINTISFHGFGRFPRGTGSYAFKNVEQLNVKALWFSKSKPKAVLEIVQALSRCPVTFPEVAFLSCPLSTPVFVRVAAELSKSTCFSAITSLSLTKSVVEPFNEAQFLAALGRFGRLEKLHLKTVPLDGSAVVAALCGLRTLRVLRVESLRFVAPFGQPLPPGLIHLDVSRCEFSGAALRSLFASVVRDDSNHVPLVFQLAAIKFRPSDLSFLRALDPEKPNDHIAEFDWSENVISREFARQLFEFLASERKLRVLTLCNANVTIPHSDFFGLLSGFALMGLDLSGSFEPAPLAQFLRSLSGAPQLRRLCVQSPGGNSVASALAELIPTLPALTEVTGDHFRIKSVDVFYRLWEAIGRHPQVRANDRPKEDSAKLKLSGAPLSQEHRALMAHVYTRTKPSTVEQRTDFVLQQVARPPDELFKLASGVGRRPRKARRAVEEAPAGSDDEPEEAPMAVPAEDQPARKKRTAADESIPIDEPPAERVQKAHARRAESPPEHRPKAAEADGQDKKKRARATSPPPLGLAKREKAPNAGRAGGEAAAPKKKFNPRALPPRKPKHPIEAAPV
jgi:hypothetical protein